LRNIDKSKTYLHPADLIPLSFLIIISVFIVSEYSRIPYWYLFIITNVIVIFLVQFLVNKYESKIDGENIDEASYNSFLKILRYWYGIAVILISFKEVYYVIYFLKPTDIDPTLMRIDFSTFGVNPTQWAYHFANPYLTEFFQIIYFYYYFMIIVYGLELYLWKRYQGFKYVIFVLFLCFFSSYLMYIFTPANGPRFHLHDFYSISKELPGVLLTEPIRQFLNFGESIPPGVTNPQDYVQRDAMPSLHVSIAILIAYLSLKIRSKSFYFYLPYVILLIASTIYLRYHYVIDIIAGIVWAGLVIFVSEIAYRRKGSRLKIRDI